MITFEIMENKEEKRRVSRTVLESLPEWFGLEKAREKYITDSANQTMIAAFDGKKEVGFVCLNETGRDTIELHVIGVLKEYHRKNIGRKLLHQAGTHLCRLRRSPWENIPNMTTPIDST